MTEPARPRAQELTVRVPVGTVLLTGDLAIPEGAGAVILFAHGSGSSRHSSRNRHVARVLNAARLATVLIDLLTLNEEEIDSRTAHLRFDIELLARRLIGVTEWLGNDAHTQHLPIGYFGASTGAAAALVAAAECPDRVGAVVSRGGRPDLAGPALADVHAPTLLLVGGNDHPVVDLNRAALAKLRCVKQLMIIEGATHLFEEPGALDQVARSARTWFETHLLQPTPRSATPT